MTEGWIYEEFDPEGRNPCPRRRPQRIRFTEGAMPELGVIGLECLQTAAAVDTVFGPEGEPLPFAGRRCYDSRECDRALSEGPPLYCDPVSRRCEIFCQNTEDCGAGLVCLDHDGDEATSGVCRDPICTRYSY